MKCPNPACDSILSPKAIVCNACGWESPKAGSSREFDPLHFLCAFDDRGERCARVGVYTESTLGSDKWYCHQHFGPFRSWAKGGQRLPNRGDIHAMRSALPKRVSDDAEAIAERFAMQAVDA